MIKNKHLTLQIFVAAAIACSSMGNSAFSDIGEAARAAAPVSLHEAIARLTPHNERNDALLLGLDSADNEQYAPNLRGQVRHAEGAAVPMSNTVGLDATTLSLELRQPLYRSGQSRAQVQASDSRLRAEAAQKLDETRARNHLIINHYIDALSADAQRKLISGFNTTKLRLDTAYKNARRELQKIAGIDSDTPLTEIDSPAGLPRTLQNALAIAEEKHPAIIRAHYECAAAEASSRSLRWEDAPDIDLRGGLDRTTDNYADSRREDSGIIGLRATIPLRGESERKSLMVQARERAESGRMKIDTTRLEIRQNVIKAWDSVTQARAEERFQTRKAELAEAAVQGRLPSHSRLLSSGNNDAFAKLARQSRLAAVQAHYDAIKAEYALLSATGQLNQALAQPQPSTLAQRDISFSLQNDTSSADISIK